MTRYEMCDAEHPEKDVTCRLEDGHDGNHSGRSYEHGVVIWRDDE